MSCSILSSTEIHSFFFLMQFLKEQKENSVMAGVVKEIESMLARGNLDLPITLCFAVTRGDDFLLHQLLKRGMDPNESDNDGHTALVSLVNYTYLCCLFFYGLMLTKKVTTFKCS